MSDFQAIADRVEIEALRGEAADAAMIRDYDRAASLFAPDAVVRVPHIHAEVIGREEIRAWLERLHVQELIRFSDGHSELNYAIYHDRYQRTGDG